MRFDLWKLPIAHLKFPYPGSCSTRHLNPRLLMRWPCLGTFVTARCISIVKTKGAEMNDDTRLVQAEPKVAALATDLVRSTQPRCSLLIACSSAKRRVCVASRLSTDSPREIPGVVRVRGWRQHIQHGNTSACSRKSARRFGSYSDRIPRCLPLWAFRSLSVATTVKEQATMPVAIEFCRRRLAWQVAPG